MITIYGVKTTTYHDVPAFYCKSEKVALDYIKQIKEWEIEERGVDPYKFLTVSRLNEEVDND